MDSVYVLEPGSYLRREGACLKILKDKKIVGEIPAAGLKRLMVVGYVSLSGGVLDFLIKQRVETVFVTPTGRFRARLTLDEHRHVALRKAQYLKLDKADVALETARIIVATKVDNMARLLARRGGQYEDDDLRSAAVQLGAMRHAVANANNMPALRGWEGAASGAYFGAFNRLIRNESFTFKGRNRRPPLDPMNAMLSFVYTLLTNEVLSAINSCGLDPYLGSLHEVSYGRPSLACDLVEEYRSGLGDRFVLGLVNRRLVATSDFVYRPAPKSFSDEAEMKARRPVEMKPAICRAFISAYEEMMARRIHYPPSGKRITYRGLLLEQARRFGEFLLGEIPHYQPFAWT